MKSRSTFRQTPTGLRLITRFRRVTVRRTLGFCLIGLLVSSSNAITAADITEQLEQLRSNANNLRKAQADFSAARRSGTLSVGEASDYANWIEQLEDQLRQECRLLTLANPASLPADLPCEQLKSGAASAAGIDLKTEQTDAERTAVMIGQLNGSLGEFDERLLREQDRVKANTPRADNSASGGGSSGANGSSAGENSGAENGATGEGQTDQTDSASQDAGQSGESSQTVGQGGQSSDSNRKGTSGQASPGNRGGTPDGIPDGRDDDVVARQLREAAETEQDPALKAKLWDEYRRYKAGS